MLAVVTLGLCWGAGLLRWLRVGPGATSLDGLLRPWLVPFGLLAAGAVAFVLAGRRLRPAARSRWLAGFVLADLVVFTLLGVVAVLPGLGSGHSGTGPGRGRGRPDSGRPHSGRPHSGAARTPRPARSPALGYPGRFAVYDPDQLDGSDLSRLGAPDLNVITRTPSVQGYSSLVSGFYAAATGSHRASGDGQDVLNPRAVGSGILDQLDTSVLLTVPAYLATRPGQSAAPAGAPGTGHRDVAARHQAIWYFAQPLGVTRLEVPDADARPDAAQGTRIGLRTSSGTTRWFPAVAVGPTRLAISLSRPLASVAVVAQAGARATRLGPASVTDSGGRVFVADGQLQDALVPPRWGYAGRDGSFAVFVDHFASGPLRLQAIPGRPAQGAAVHRLGGSAAAPASAAVFSPHGVRVIRSVTATAGWSATWRPRHGQPAALAVRRDGLVQAVQVPAGRGVLTWSYRPPGLRTGAALSLGAIVLIASMLAAGLGTRAARNRPG